MRLLQKLVDRKDLSREEATEAMDLIMAGNFTDAQVASFLTAMKMKGETREELAAFALSMRKNALSIRPRRPSGEVLVDTCGTGGDSSSTFNVSTAAALVACGAGVLVAKHGNRSVSSTCGSADVLEELGVKMLSPPEVERCIEEIGFGFLFAPFFHPAMKHVAHVRKELGMPMLFNLLGPLSNPAGVERHLVGVFSPSLTEELAHVLRLLGSTHALVVNSEGVDEIGLTETRVSELKGGAVQSYLLDASSLGFSQEPIPKVSSKEAAAEMLRGVLRGERGPARDVTVLNAAAAIYVSGKTSTLKAGIGSAERALDTGRAQEKLEQLVKFGGN